MFYRRHLSGPLSSSVSNNKVRLVFGARQTGKTELLKRIVPPETAVFFDLGATDQRRRFETDPARFGREARALPAKVRNIVVDEIQKVPAILDEVQNLFDEKRSRFQIYLTGSSARNLRRHSANLLPGRSHLFRLLPVCRWESEGPERYDWPEPEPASPSGRSAPDPATHATWRLSFPSIQGALAKDCWSAAAIAPSGFRSTFSQFRGTGSNPGRRISTRCGSKPTQLGSVNHEMRPVAQLTPVEP